MAVLLVLTAGTAVADPSAQVVGGTRASIKDNPLAVYLTPPADTREPRCTGVVVAGRENVHSTGETHEDRQQPRLRRHLV